MISELSLVHWRLGSQETFFDFKYLSDHYCTADYTVKMLDAMKFKSTNQYFCDNSFCVWIKVGNTTGKTGARNLTVDGSIPFLYINDAVTMGNVSTFPIDNM